MESLKTALYEAHQAAGGKMVDFFGWVLPLHYGSQIQEHEAVRNDAGVFDVSHMLVTEVVGEEAESWLRYLLANDVAKLKTVGKALYSPMLNETGGVIDDLIVYRLNAEKTAYRIISNGATRDKNTQHFLKTSVGFKVNVTPYPDYALLAIQGPQALAKLWKVKSQWQTQVETLSPFQGLAVEAGYFIAKTGYTGEDGVEVVMPTVDAPNFFQALLQAGITPCGLGARDTLRLEAGMNLYGNEMDETVSPLESGLAWTVDWHDEARDFIGKQALMAQKAQGIAMKLVGLVLEGRGVLRHGMLVQTIAGEGIVTSGTFSPSLHTSIALARVPLATDSTANVVMRQQRMPVRVVTLPFVRHGKKQF